MLIHEFVIYFSFQEAKKFLLGPLPECFTELQDKLVPIFVLKTNIYQVILVWLLDCLH